MPCLSRLVHWALDIDRTAYGRPGALSYTGPRPGLRPRTRREAASSSGNPKLDERLDARIEWAMVHGHELCRKTVETRRHLEILGQAVAHRDKRAVEEEMDVALIRYQLRRCEGDDPSAGQTEPHRDGRRVASERRPLFGGEELQTGGGGGPAGGDHRPDDGRQDDGQDERSGGEHRGRQSGGLREPSKSPAPQPLEGDEAEQE